MEYLSNVCEYNEAILTEALTAQFRETQRRKNLIFYVLVSLLLVFCLVNWFISKDSYYLLLSAFCLLLYGMLVFNSRILPRRTAKLQIPRIQEKNGGLQFQTRFLEDGAAVLNPMGEESARVPYGQLAKLVETEQLILLFNRDKQMIILDRSGFRGGDEAAFRQLLKERCPVLLPLERK